MINIQDKRKCCGCTACASVCSHHCISMVEDAEGFKYPQVDTEKCVNCGLCEKVCPMLHPESDNEVHNVIGAKHKDAAVRRASSSGGAFSLIAEEFIANGGVVVGCAMDENLQAKHIICTNKEDLVKLRSSKYVQSNMDGVYPQIRRLLREGRKVLFSGTPCQVAGLHRYLIKSYDNLYCIDVLCHGVPSPKLFREYKEIMEAKYKAKANYVSYRCKKKEWKRLYINLKFDNNKEYFKSATFDPYMQLFLGNISQRSSCFYCPFTTTNRQGDISLGDFWGIGRNHPELDDDKGISMILLNTNKGEEMFRGIKNDIDSFDSNINEAIAGNKVLVENITGEVKRNHFYADYVSEGLQCALEKNTIKYSPLKQSYIRFMRLSLDLLRKITHKGY